MHFVRGLLTDIFYSVYIFFILHMSYLWQQYNIFTVMKQQLQIVTLGGHNCCIVIFFEKKKLLYRRIQFFISPTRDAVVRNKTFFFVCVCLFVRTIKPKRLKVRSPNLPVGEDSWWIIPVANLILGQKVKVTESESVKTYWRRSSGRRELCTRLSTRPPSWISILGHNFGVDQHFSPNLVPRWIITSPRRPIAQNQVIPWQ